jgi:hypothetical protein
MVMVIENEVILPQKVDGQSKKIHISTSTCTIPAKIGSFDPE